MEWEPQEQPASVEAAILGIVFWSVFFGLCVFVCRLLQRYPEASIFSRRILGVYGRGPLTYSPSLRSTFTPTVIARWSWQKVAIHMIAFGLAAILFNWIYTEIIATEFWGLPVL